MPLWLVRWNHWNLLKRMGTRCNRVTFETRCSEHGHPATWHRRPHQASQLLVAPDAVLKCSSYVIFIPKAFGGHCRGLWWKEEGGLHGNSEFTNMTLQCGHQIASTCYVQTRINRRTNFCDWSRGFGLSRFGGDVGDGKSLPSIQMVCIQFSSWLDLLRKRLVHIRSFIICFSVPKRFQKGLCLLL